jgi:4-hydroxyphenylpyruvate dioxygenase
MTQKNITENPLATDGFEFLEFATPDPSKMVNDFVAFGFDAQSNHVDKDVTHFQQGDIHFLVNNDSRTHAADFAKKHGPCVSAMGFRVKDAKLAFEKAVARGAQAYDGKAGEKTLELPAIYGIGGSLIYFVDTYGTQKNIYQKYFPVAEISTVKFIKSGLSYLDHVTHNVYQGNMDKWANFYEDIFNFHEIRYFDIKGKMTGLVSRAMTSPCGKIRIPINEATDNKSQIAEYLQAYKGEGIQHIALGSVDIYSSVEMLREDGVAFLSVPESYYKLLEKRIPNHGEDIARLQKNKILIDGTVDTDKTNLLLQLFTKNMIGPVFFEIIQRKGNEGFGEGNFQALFDAIEQDQIDRGVLSADK